MINIYICMPFIKNYQNGYFCMEESFSYFRISLHAWILPEPEHEQFWYNKKYKLDMCLCHKYCPHVRQVCHENNPQQKQPCFQYVFFYYCCCGFNQCCICNLFPYINLRVFFCLQNSPLEHFKIIICLNLSNFRSLSEFVKL